MKLKYFFIFLLFTFASYMSSAEVLIYKGSTRVTNMGGTPQPYFSAFLIYEIETGVWQVLFYSAYTDPTTGQRKKFNDRVGLPDLKKLEVDRHSNHVHTVFYRIENEIEEDLTVTSQSVWIKGENKTLKTKLNTTYLFPARFNFDMRIARESQDIGDGLKHGGVNELHGNFVFSPYQTGIANNAGETITATFMRLQASR
jgi:hypothetical protein